MTSNSWAKSAPMPPTNCTHATTCIEAIYMTRHRTKGIPLDWDSRFTKDYLFELQKITKILPKPTLFQACTCGNFAQLVPQARGLILIENSKFEQMLTCLYQNKGAEILIDSCTTRLTFYSKRVIVISNIPWKQKACTTCTTWIRYRVRWSGLCHACSKVV